MKKPGDPLSDELIGEITDRILEVAPMLPLDAYGFIVSALRQGRPVIAWTKGGVASFFQIRRSWLRHFQEAEMSDNPYNFLIGAAFAVGVFLLAMVVLPRR